MLRNREPRDLKPIKRLLISPTFWVSGLILVFAVIYLSGCFELSFGTLSSPEEGFLPFICGAILLGLIGISLLLQIVGDNANIEKELPSKTEVVNGTKLIVILILYTALLPVLGFSVCTFLGTIGSSKVMGANFKRGTILAAAITAIAFILFKKWLHIPLPPPFFMQ